MEVRELTIRRESGSTTDVKQNISKQASPKKFTSTILFVIVLSILIVAGVFLTLLTVQLMKTPEVDKTTRGFAISATVLAWIAAIAILAATVFSYVSYKNTSDENLQFTSIEDALEKDRSGTSYIWIALGLGAIFALISGIFSTLVLIRVRSIGSTTLTYSIISTVAIFGALLFGLIAIISFGSTSKSLAYIREEAPKEEKKLKEQSKKLKEELNELERKMRNQENTDGISPNYQSPLEKINFE